MNALNIEGNPLEIDLHRLMKKTQGPLRSVRVDVHQISRGLTGKQHRHFLVEVRQAAMAWMRLSTLDFLALGKDRYVLGKVSTANKTFIAGATDKLFYLDP